ncbi:hypothetical protein [Lysinibacillus piscis]|uniref:DUF1836 domain-containing protein n=1 Tax=Lysinibacillus piscis TaxID=2518931 RepID=A0ABQ5NK93_9BACI|nr:hypothetical protein [Lysinibacillus sp. KH24]GLC88492.1 hypothetical protein LYSBPC_16190 [Lysinibacillus sp. KH24]
MSINDIEISLTNLEKPLLLISEEDEQLFQTLLQEVLTYKQWPLLALSTKASTSLVKDIWCALYRENVFINNEYAMFYPIRFILFELVMQEESIRHLAKKSLDHEYLSFIYAVIYTQLILHWLKERLSMDREVYEAVKLLYYSVEKENDEESEELSREFTIAQAIAVKAIRVEVQQNVRQFANQMRHAYELVQDIKIDTVTEMGPLLDKLAASFE